MSMSDPTAPIVWPKGQPKILVWDIETTSLSGDMGEVLMIGFMHPVWKQPRIVRMDDFYGWDSCVVERRDFFLCKWFVEWVHDVDFLVGHYSAPGHFDWPFMEFRCLYHRLGPLPPVSHIDTYTVAKQHFALNSRRLAACAEALDVPHRKTSVAKKWWRRAGAHKVEAFDKLAPYCKGDVLATRDVFELERLLWGMPNFQLSDDGAEARCTNCGSTHLESKGIRRTATQAYRRYRCYDCKKPMSGRTTLVRGGKQLRG
jgi:DNA-directed RNA polymerase subunit RPC12/RpoP/DNA polymerase elongation subunit (family B)